MLGDMKYGMRSVKRVEEALGMWAEYNWYVNRVNSLYTMVSERLVFNMNNRSDSLSFS